MQDADLKTQLLEVENKYWKAVQDRDVEAAMSLTDNPSMVSGATGFMTVDPEKFKKIMSNASYTLNDFKIGDDAQVRQLSDDIAILSYKVHEDLTVDGKPVAMDAADSSVWVRRDGQWRCALHTESLLGDPYGRDRKAIN